MELCLEDSIILHPDSSYVVGFCFNRFAIKENIVLARLLRHLWKEASKYVLLDCVWTKAYSNDNANNHVDHLTGLGTNSSLFNKFHIRPIWFLSDWSGLEYLAAIGALSWEQVAARSLELEDRFRVSRNCVTAYYAGLREAKQANIQSHGQGELPAKDVAMATAQHF